MPDGSPVSQPSTPTTGDNSSTASLTSTAVLSATTTTMSTSFVYQPVIQQPKPIDLSCDKEENYRVFVSSWRTFSVLTELDKRPVEYQCAMLKHCVGADCVKVVESNATYSNSSTVDDILEILQAYCIGERNIVHDRYLFNSVTQSGSETFESFYLTLRHKAQHCKFLAMEDDLIRDRIVLGVHCDNTRRKLIAYGNALTLDAALRICRSQELATKAMQDLSAVNRPVSEINALAKASNRQAASKSFTRSQQPKSCGWCGGNRHSREKCPANGKICSACHKANHFAKVCRSSDKPKEVLSTAIAAAEESAADEDDIKVFTYQIDIDALSESASEWSAIVGVDSQLVKFKLDSGADATIIKSTDPCLRNISLLPTNVRLVGPSNHNIQCIGKFEATLTHESRSFVDTIYVIESQNTNLLGRRACHELSLLTCNVKQIHAVNKNIQAQYPALFQGLGCIKGYAYDIKLNDDAIPRSIYTARTVPQPLRNRTKQKLDQMVSQGTISPVTEPTDWCSAMVVVPKSGTDDVRVCVDFTHLNQSVRRELHPMSAVEDSLAQLGQSKIFTKLDANSGFHQIKLTAQSRLLTTFLTPFGRFCYNRMPMGISAASEIFQRCMADMLAGLEGVIIHMDDILIHGTTQQEHDARLEAALTRMERAGMTLNATKCVFSQLSVKYLGHIIDSNEVHPDPVKSRLLWTSRNQAIDRISGV